MKRLAAVFALMSSAALAGCSRSGDNAELENRVKQLESEVSRLKEIEAFIRPIMKQQQAEADKEAAREPDPTATFAVDVTGNQFDGPADAAVTIVEAFDFA